MDLSVLLAPAFLLTLVAGALAGTGVLLLVMAVRGFPVRPPRPPGESSERMQRRLTEIFGARGAMALAAGVLVLVATGWVVAAGGTVALVLGWRGLGGATAERKAIARLEGLAIWTESLRDTIAGAVGLEQAIPVSLRVAAPSLAEPLARLADRLHTRMPMPEALHMFADDLDDSGSDLIIAALIINSRLRGPGLRDLLGALSGSVREELDMRRKVTAQRRSTRRSVQIVVAVSVGMAFGLAFLDRSYMHYYNSLAGQLVLVVVVGLYAVSFIWLRKLAKYAAPERLLAIRPTTPVFPPAGSPGDLGAMAGGTV
jgi:Flp pilus assembly protein TadB